MYLSNRLFASTVCVLCVALPLRPMAGQEEPLGQVLSRAAAYLDDFERQLSGIVAEESYVQDTRDWRRALRSDLLMIRVAGEAHYVEFRDVFEVDGRAVRDREERLTRLFLDPSASATTQLQAIVAESARYNIGPLTRTMNTPTLALIFLRSENQHGLTFKVTNKATPLLSRLALINEGVASDFAAMPAGTAVVAFDEHGHNTFIRKAGNKDLPANGRFWIDPATGRVLMSELVADDSAIVGTIDVRYRFEPSVGMMVPSEMRERYRTFGKPDIEGRATYDHFRTFQVQTSTDIQPVK